MIKTCFLIVTIFVFQFSIAQSLNTLKNSEVYDYETVDLRPSFPGGINEFFKFIGKNYVTPDVEGLSGVVKISFVIEMDGKVNEIKIVKDVGEGSGNEAIRVMSLSPKWFPGEQEGRRVRVLCEFPIRINN